MELARRVDCAQSAISMMEGGNASALARSTLEGISKILGVEIPPETPASEIAPVPSPAGIRICPNADCPSNLPYRVGPEVLFLPRAQRMAGSRCPICGEILLSSCPECGKPIQEGSACCPDCGTALVPSTIETAAATDAWLERRQRQSGLLLSWNAPA